MSGYHLLTLPLRSLLLINKQWLISAIPSLFRAPGKSKHLGIVSIVKRPPITLKFTPKWSRGNGYRDWVQVQTLCLHSELWGTAVYTVDAHKEGILQFQQEACTICVCTYNGRTILICFLSFTWSGLGIIHETNHVLMLRCVWVCVCVCMCTAGTVSD